MTGTNPEANEIQAITNARENARLKAIGALQDAIKSLEVGHEVFDEAAIKQIHIGLEAIPPSSKE